MGTENAFEVTARLVARGYEEKIATKDARISRLEADNRNLAKEADELQEAVRVAQARIEELEMGLKLLQAYNAKCDDQNKQAHAEIARLERVADGRQYENN